MNEDAAQPIESLNGMDEAEAAAQYRLMTWLSPAFPVGAFSYSSGIEWAVEAGDIGDAASLRDWLSSVLADGSGFCDGVFLAHAHRATASRDGPALRDIAELAAAFVPSRERYLETSAQGRAFIDIARAAWNCGGLDAIIACCDGAIVYPIAVGLVSAAHEIPLAPTMHAFLHTLASSWISAGARLIPLGGNAMRGRVALLLICVALLVPSCRRARPPAAVAPPRPTRYELQIGRNVFRTYCAGCHGETGAGDGFNAFNLDPHPRDLGDPAFQKSKSNADLADAIRRGGAGVGLTSLMPPWGHTLDARHIDVVVLYIRSLHR